MSNLAVAAPYCKSCLDRGHQCHATRHVENENWCEACLGGEDCGQTALELPPPIEVPGQLLKAAPDARDLLAVLTKTMAGLFDGTISPKLANAMCQTSSAMIKAMQVAKAMEKK